MYKYKRTFPHLDSLISSHISLSLLHRNESLLYYAEMGLSFTHVKPEVVEFEAATAEVKIDLRGIEYLLFGTML